MAPRRWCRANRSSLSRSDSGSPSDCPAASKTYHNLYFKQRNTFPEALNHSFYLYVSMCEWLHEVQEEALQIRLYQSFNHLLLPAVISYLPGLYIEAWDNDLLGLGMVLLSAPWKHRWKGWSTKHTKRFRISYWGNRIRLGWLELIKTDVGASDTGFWRTKESMWRMATEGETRIKCGLAKMMLLSILTCSVSDVTVNFLFMTSFNRNFLICQRCLNNETHNISNLEDIKKLLCGEHCVLVNIVEGTW